MLKKFIIAVFVLFIVGAGIFFAVQNTEKERSGGGRIEAVATIFPIYDIVRTVAGEDAGVSLLIPPGASPHTLDITPDIAAKIEQADVIFAIGRGLDDFLLRDTRKVRYVDAGVAVRKSGTGRADPHYWMSPANAEIIAETIANEFAKRDPDRAGLYRARAKAFRSALADKEREWREVYPVAGRKIITFHDAFAYFADYFGITILETVEEIPGRKPTAQDLARLREIIRENNITAIFIEPQLSESVISQFAKDAGLKVETLDPIGGDEGQSSYLELIEYNLRKITSSL